MIRDVWDVQREASLTFYAEGAMLSREAMKRLQVIKRISEPGSGFRIAYNDLESAEEGICWGFAVRHISLLVIITRIMEKRSEIKEKKPKKKSCCRNQMGISAYIPEEYVQMFIAYVCIKESLWPEMMKKLSD